jgi:hypothetical protein
LEIKAYIEYCYAIYVGLVSFMSVEQKAEEMRWQVLKAMLDEFPVLREKTKVYLDCKKLRK